jgi:hypothetical protein
VLLSPRIVVGCNLACAISQRDYSIGILGHHRLFDRDDINPHAARYRMAVLIVTTRPWVP